MVVAFKAKGALWAVLIFFFSLLAGLIFCIMEKTGWMQWLMMTRRLAVLMIVGGGMAAMSQMGQ